MRSVYTTTMNDFTISEDRNNDLEAWLEYGKKQGWIIPKVFCNTHDGVPMTDEEMTEFDDGGDPCIHVIRIFEAPEQQEQALRNSGV
jgi:hypothetical protein